MIQVIQRAFQIIEHLSPAEGVPLGDLASSLNINKGTLCNILKSLIDLGYVGKTRNGHYVISPAFYNLALPYTNNNLMHKIAQKHADMLAEGTRESGVVATLRNNAIYIVAQSRFQRRLMVETKSYDDLSLYHSVTGRIIISHLCESTRRKLIEVHGYPGSEWSNIDSLEKLQCATDAICEEGIAVMSNKHEGIKAFAVPVFDAHNNFCASLGITVPASRLDDGNEAMVIAVLKKASEHLTQANFKQNLTQSDWFGEQLG